MKRYFFSLLLTVLSTFCLAQKKSEFRAAWIATVSNIDWPSNPAISVDSQKTEYINLLNMHVRNGMNAVIVQIRPATDAFYPSPLEPWSEWLTAKQGRPPAKYYDVLKFMIDEAHKRGLEFHAWCNPYRAEFAIGKSSIAPTHVTKIHPEWFLTYGGTRYFDPGNKEAQKFVVNVIRDIVRRYDVDAIHFDDYFYPYRITGKEFPDSLSYYKYGRGLLRDDWRRSNVDSVIMMLSQAIKEENKFCKFGISPFGVWRNKSKDPEGSDTKAGQTNYDDLFADILLWLKQGWIDYVAPQIYWEFTQPNAPFEPILNWWSSHTYGKQCFIGLGIYRGAGTNVAAPWRDPTLLPRQVALTQNTPNIQGAIYFSSKSFIKNPNGWNDSLQNHYYKYPAIIPPMEWIDTRKPEPPVVEKISEGHWKMSAPDESVKAIVLYVSCGDSSHIQQIAPGRSFEFNATDANCKFAVTALSRTNNESRLVTLE